MPKEIIEILSACGSDDAVHRMKLNALIKLTNNEFDYRQFEQGCKNPAAILLRIDFLRPIRDEVIEIMRRKSQYAVIMMFVPDFLPAHVQSLRNLANIVDVFLVPTPEMRNQLRAFTNRPVEVLVDPIDFCLMQSYSKPIIDDDRVDKPLRLVWFGYPESYNKSMLEYEQSIRSMVRNNEIEFHLITKNNFYGQASFFKLHEYVADTFLALLQSFDVCITSHAPFDFSVSTYSKSVVSG